MKSPGFFKPYLFILNREHASPGQDGFGGIGRVIVARGISPGQKWRGSFLRRQISWSHWKGKI
jgi:hypothetical protein